MTDKKVTFQESESADIQTPDLANVLSNGLGGLAGIPGVQGMDINDPFGTSISAENDLKKFHSLEIHITIKKRNAKKMTTTVTGLNNKDFDLAKIAKAIKKTQCCNGTAQKETGNLVFSGDQRQVVSQYLQDRYGVDKKQIIIHGF